MDVEKKQSHRRDALQRVRWFGGRAGRTPFGTRPYKVLSGSIAFIFLMLLSIGIPLSAQRPQPEPIPETVMLSAADALNTTAISPRDRVDLARRLRGISVAESTPRTAQNRNVGDQETFYVTNSTDELVIQVPATLRVISDHLYLWVENSGNVDVAALQTLADAFDERVYDDVRLLWGEEANPGIDGDSRVHGLFTSEVGASVAASFMSDHTLPRAVVPTSNEREMFFFNLSAFRYYTPETVESVVAHEFQHMIRYNLQMNEETWMNEGFSEFTQTYLYQPDYDTIEIFLYEPDTQVNGWAEDIRLRAANYGAAGLFITYFHDRYGLPALNTLSADPAPRGLQAMDNVLRAAGEPGVDVFFADWVVANFLFDANVATGIYGYRSLYIYTNAFTRPTINKYPSSITQTVSQYGTDYFTLIDYGDTDRLSIRLNAPATVNVIPAQPTSGDRFFYSNRADMSDTTLTRAFDLTGVSAATLAYSVWYHLEENWDYGYVMVSADDGDSWDILQTDESTTANLHQTAYGAGYTGMSGGGSAPAWVQEQILLDAYAGQNILVRFEVITDDAINQHGLALDDVRVDAVDYAADFEADDGGWDAAGWLWTDNTLNQRAWVQVIQQTGAGAVGELAVFEDAEITRWEYPADLSDDGTFMLDLADNVGRVTIAVSAFAPVTTVPMRYTLAVDTQ